MTTTGLNVVITGDSKGLQAALAKASGSVSGFEKRMQTAGRTMQTAGRGLTAALTVPIVGIGVASGAAAAQFQASMELIHTQAGATQGEVKKLSAEVLNLSEHSTQAPNDLAQALYRLEGAGLRGAKAMDALKASSQLATVGQANVEDTAKTLAQTWFVGIKGAGDFNNVVAELNATVGAGDLRLQQLVDALGTGILPAAKQAGLQLQDVTGALAVFGDETNNVSGFAAQLATAFHFLTNPTAKAQTALQALGLSQAQFVRDLAQPHGLLIALTSLRDKLDQLPGGAKGPQAQQVLGDILPGGRGRVLLVLMNQLDRYKMKLDQIAATHSKFGDSVRRSMELPANQLKMAWAGVQASLVRVGAAVLPAVTPVLTSFGKDVEGVAHAFDNLSPGAKQFAVEAAAGVAAVGPLVLILGKLVSATGTVYGATAKVIGAISGASAAQTEEVASTNALTAATERLTVAMGGLAEAQVATTESGALMSGSSMFGNLRGASAAAAPASSAGAGLAGSLMSGLARALPVAAGTYAIGNVVSSVISGNTQDAAAEAGGSIAGGVIGGLVGGLPGAAIGAGLGSAVGELISGIFGGGSTGPDLTTLQGRLEQSARDLTTALQDEATAFHAVHDAATGVQTAHLNVRQATVNVKRAQDAYTKAVWESGKGSLRAQQADLDLRKARIQLRDATHQETVAEHRQAAAQGAASDTAGTVQAVAHDRIRTLQQQHKHLVAVYQADRQAGVGAKRLAGDEQALIDNERTLRRVRAQEADATDKARKANHDWIQSLHLGKSEVHDTRQHLQSFLAALRFNNTALLETHDKTIAAAQAFGQVQIPLGQLTGKTGSQTRSQDLNKQSLDSWTQFVRQSFQPSVQQVITKTATAGTTFESASRKTHGAAKQMGSNITSLADIVAAGESNIAGNTRKSLSAFGANTKAFDFQLTGPGKGKARGGQLPGYSRTDNMLVPMRGGEWVLTPEEQAPIADAAMQLAFGFGLGDLMAATGGSVGFAKGGQVGSMAAMLAEANAYERAHEPYLLGGGHGSFALKPTPVDCSGFVSAVLHAGGLLNGAPMVSGSLMNWGKPGHGALTVYANPAHTFMSLNGAYYGTSGSNPGGGAGLVQSGYPAGYLAGFAARTMDAAGGTAGIPRQLIKGGSAVLRGLGQGALDRDRKAAEAYIRSKMPRGVAGGGNAAVIDQTKALPGGWFHTGATYEGLTGNRGSAGVPVGSGFAELLVQGANIGMWRQDLAATLGLPNKPQYGMPDFTKIYVRRAGSGSALTIEKNDVGSGQPGNAFYKVDLQQRVLQAMGSGLVTQPVEVRRFGKARGGRIPGGLGALLGGSRGLARPGAQTGSAGFLAPPTGLSGLLLHAHDLRHSIKLLQHDEQHLSHPQHQHLNDLITQLQDQLSGHTLSPSQRRQVQHELDLHRRQLNLAQLTDHERRKRESAIHAELHHLRSLKHPSAADSKREQRLATKLTELQDSAKLSHHDVRTLRSEIATERADLHSRTPTPAEKHHLQEQIKAAQFREAHGGLSPAEYHREQQRIKHEQAQLDVLTELISETRALRKEVQTQNDLAARGIAVNRAELTRAVADLLSGELGFQTEASSRMAGAGSSYRY